MKYQYY